MKVRIFKFSGNEVNQEGAKSFLEDWRILFDKIAERVDVIKSNPDERFFSAPKHTLSSRFCNYVEYVLRKKHNLDVEENLPVSAKQWKALIDKYDRAPIMVGRQRDSDNLVLFIMDDLT